MLERDEGSIWGEHLSFGAVTRVSLRRAMEGWLNIMQQPVIADQFAHLDDVFEIHRFHHERVGPEFVSDIDVAHFLRGGEDDNEQRAKARLLAKPAKHLESIHAGHFEIK